MDADFYQRAPRCLEDKSILKFKPFSIKTLDGKSFPNAFSYCENCKKYLSDKGMEKNIKKVALEHIRSFDHSYELSDIAEIKEIKPSK